MQEPPYQDVETLIKILKRYASDDRYQNARLARRVEERFGASAGDLLWAAWRRGCPEVAAARPLGALLARGEFTALELQGWLKEIEPPGAPLGQRAARNAGDWLEDAFPLILRAAERGMADLHPWWQALAEPRRDAAGAALALAGLIPAAEGPADLVNRLLCHLEDSHALRALLGPHHRRAWPQGELGRALVRLQAQHSWGLSGLEPYLECAAPEDLLAGLTGSDAPKRGWFEQFLPDTADTRALLVEALREDARWADRRPGRRMVLAVLARRLAGSGEALPEDLAAGLPALAATGAASLEDLRLLLPLYDPALQEAIIGARRHPWPLMPEQPSAELIRLVVRQIGKPRRDRSYSEEHREDQEERQGLQGLAARRPDDVLAALCAEPHPQDLLILQALSPHLAARHAPALARLAADRPALAAPLSLTLAGQGDDALPALEALWADKPARAWAVSVLAQMADTPALRGLCRRLLEGALSLPLREGLLAIVGEGEGAEGERVQLRRALGRDARRAIYARLAALRRDRDAREEDDPLQGLLAPGAPALAAVADWYLATSGAGSWEEYELASIWRRALEETLWDPPSARLAVWLVQARPDDPKHPRQFYDFASAYREVEPSLPADARAAAHAAVEALCGAASPLQSQARSWLIEFDPAAHLPEVLGELARRDSCIRDRYLRAIAKVPADQAVPALVEMLKDRSYGAREGAALALGALQAPAARPALQEALAKETSKVVRAALQQALQAPAPPPVLDLAAATDAAIDAHFAALPAPDAPIKGLILPPLRWASGGPVGERTALALAALLPRLKRGEPAPPDLVSLCSRLDPASAAALVDALRFSALSETGKALAHGYLADEAQIARLAGLLHKTGVRSARSVFVEDALEALARRASPAAIHALDLISDKGRQHRLRDGAGERLADLARARGVSPLELAMECFPDHGFDARGERALPGGLVLCLDAESRLHLRDAAGRPLPRVPASLPKPIREEIKDLRAEIGAAIEWQRERLEQAMVQGQSWGAPLFRRLFLAHPLLSALGQGLVWRAWPADGPPACFLVSPEREPLTAAADPFDLAPAARIEIPHPIDLGEDERASWRAILADLDVPAPFPQIDRPVYAPADRGAALAAAIPPDRLFSPTLLTSRLKKLGWQSDLEGDEVTGATRSFGEAGLVYLAHDPYRFEDEDPGDDIEVKAVRFSVDLPAVHPRAFSEALRDLHALFAISHEV